MAHETGFYTDGKGQLNSFGFYENTGVSTGDQFSSDKNVQYELSHVSSYQFGEVHHGVSLSQQQLTLPNFTASSYSFFSHNCQSYIDELQNRAIIPR